MTFARQLFSQDVSISTITQQRQKEERRNLVYASPSQNKPEVVDLTEESIQSEIDTIEERMEYLNQLVLVRAFLRDTIRTSLPHGTTLHMLRDVINSEINEQERTSRPQPSQQ